MFLIIFSSKERLISNLFIEYYIYWFIGHRAGVPKIAVVITDGNSANRASTLAEAQKARASGMEVIAIGVGHGINQGELEGIASKPKSQFVYNAENFDVLNTLQASLSSKTCEGTYFSND